MNITNFQNDWLLLRTADCCFYPFTVCRFKQFHRISGLLRAGLCTRLVSDRTPAEISLFPRDQSPISVYPETGGLNHRAPNQFWWKRRESQTYGQPERNTSKMGNIAHKSQSHIYSIADPKPRIDNTRMHSSVIG